MINKDCEKDKGMTVVVHTKSQKNRLKMNPVHDCGECKPFSFERPFVNYYFKWFDLTICCEKKW